MCKIEMQRVLFGFSYFLSYTKFSPRSNTRVIICKEFKVYFSFFLKKNSSLLRSSRKGVKVWLIDVHIIKGPKFFPRSNCLCLILFSPRSHPTALKQRMRRKMARAADKPASFEEESAMHNKSLSLSLSWQNKLSRPTTLLQHQSIACPAEQICSPGKRKE